MKTIFLFTLALWNSVLAYGQNGTIKGIVLDEQSKSPLEGATIELLNAEIKTGVITDANGRFVLRDVPLGRQRIRISYIGFETRIQENIEVRSGKDVVLRITLLESFDQLDEVVLSNDNSKNRPLNSLATVSARQFGLEEVTRFSGGRGDVARLAANFAGVSTPDDSRNDIVVRGNSPTGLLWKLEGIPIPNPNHFAAFGATGGPVSAINSNVLKNSDFFTSAFPAEYGNALGGVFDLGFRKGNADDYEFSLQLGAFTGLEANAEGPLGKKNGSFLAAFRYSLVALIGAGAGGASTATPNYGDLAFHLDFGKGKFGALSIFGIFGTSNIDFLGEETDTDDLFAAEDEDLFVKSSFGVLGLKHRTTLGEQSFLGSTIAVAQSSNAITANRLLDFNMPTERSVLFSEIDNAETRLSLSTFLNSKLSKKITIKAGASLAYFDVRSLLRDREEQTDQDGDGDPDLFTFRDAKNNFLLWQPYAQLQWRVSQDLILTSGLRGMYSSLNKQTAIAPRAGLSYQISDKHSIQLGYGIHRQSVPLPLLFLGEERNGNLVQPNRKLDFVRSDHYVLGYDVKIAPNWHGKLECYYQDISNAAVESFPSSYSSLTEGSDFVFDNNRISLNNGGTGFNRGIELTVEKFFSNDYYGLLTTSLFESRYRGSDGIERNTPFNNQYTINLLMGKEFSLGPLRHHKLFFDTRFATAGGRFFTPVDILNSQENGFEVLLEDEAFSTQNDSYLRWDFKFGITLNSKQKKQSHQFFLDLQNITNRRNVFAQRFNRLTNDINQIDQVGFFPNIGYTYQF
ncbi:TonB-dependent receptor [Spongiimicrobium salis]|uniref:TonB-dependent receptor n=1 Tax=Spongiimicrobium salis TaxID=1667022 RepID=UPI00374D7F08